ncbi:putative Cystatin domain-containing protein [Helianthus annuus]|nr:putative Cystatin domain-containing protein [Helianthus annuus]
MSFSPNSVNFNFLLLNLNKWTPHEGILVILLSCEVHLNALLEFGKVVNTKEQVVAGKMYYITLEATDGGVKKTYEAKVWVKPWENFKELQEFKPVDAATSA